MKQLEAFWHIQKSTKHLEFISDGPRSEKKALQNLKAIEGNRIS